MLRQNLLISSYFLLSLALIAGCSSTVSPPTATRVFTLSAGSVDFGNTRMGICADSTLGATRDTILALHNTGNDTLRIDSVTSPSAAFSVLYSSSKVAPGDTGSIHIRFCPTFLGAASSSVTMTDNATSGGTTIIAVMGTGIRYMPYAGSYFTYDQQGLDSAMKPIGNPTPTTINIIVSGLTYQGKTNVELTSDSTYFKIEDNGDVSIWSVGYPTYPATVRVDSGWLTLPFQTQGQNLLLLTGDHTFLDSAGESITMQVRDSASYLGTSTLTIGTRQFQVMEVRLTQLAVYSSSKGAIGRMGIFDGFFAPEIGFIVQQGKFGGSEVIVGKKIVQKQGSGEFRKLKNFSLK